MLALFFHNLSEPFKLELGRHTQHLTYQVVLSGRLSLTVKQYCLENETVYKFNASFVVGME